MSKPVERMFKKVDGLEISLDIYLPAKATIEKPVPVVIWWHGGGCLQGTRKGVAPHLYRSVELHEICVVSADYRLAPQTRLPGIISDVRDAVAYIQSEEFSIDVEEKADSSRLVVCGSSAGGWLALIAASELGYKECGIESNPNKISGVIPIYPITDITAPFWTTKQRPVSYMNGRIIDGPKDLGDMLDPNGQKLAFSALDSPRSIFYHYMIQEAILQELLLDGTGIPARIFSVAPAIEEGKISMPPTLMTHGTIDDKVPIDQAEVVYEALKKKGIEVQMIREEGKDHLYDRDASEHMEEMYSFIRKVTSRT